MFTGRWGAIGGHRLAGSPLGLAAAILSLLAQNGLCTELPPVVRGDGQREVDLVLECMYLEEKAGHPGAFASGFTHDSATLVLRGARVMEGKHLDSYNDFDPQDAEENIIFEAKGSWLDVLAAETILHADCNGQEVTCEISRYFPPSKRQERGQEEVGLGKEEAELRKEEVMLEQEKSALQQEEVELHQKEAGLHQEAVELQEEAVGLQEEAVGLHQEEADLQQGEALLKQEEAVLQHEELTWASSWFIFYIQIPEGNFSITMVMNTLTNRNERDGEPKLHPRLKVPLSNLGTVPMSVDLSVSTCTPSLLTAIGNTVMLDCGLLSPSSDTAVVEWRIQHQGNGRVIYQYLPGEKERIWRPRTGVNLQRLRDLGDASLTIADFGVKDEGTYICLITTSTGHAQQIVRVQVQEPPRVTLSVQPLPHAAIPKTILTCEMTGFFPLDVHVEWTQKAPGDGQEPLDISESYSSSHRQNRDGTFSISSSIDVKVSSVEEEGTAYTCTITHISLKEPITASIQLDPAAGSARLFGAIILCTLLLITVLCYLNIKVKDQDHVTPKDTEGQKLKVN